MYLVFRGIERRDVQARRSGAQRARGAQVGGDRRARASPAARAAMALLDQTGADDPLAAPGARAARRRAGPARPEPRPRSSAWGRRVRGVVPRPRPSAAGSSRVVTWWFVVVGVAAAGRRGARSRSTTSAIRGFAEWASVISSGVSGALIVVGAVRLPPPPAVGVPLVRPRAARADLRDPGVRVRAASSSPACSASCSTSCCGWRSAP